MSLRLLAEDAVARCKRSEAELERHRAARTDLQRECTRLASVAAAYAGDRAALQSEVDVARASAMAQ